MKLSLPEVANLLGKSERQVRYMIKQDRLRAGCRQLVGVCHPLVDNCQRRGSAPDPVSDRGGTE